MTVPSLSEAQPAEAPSVEDIQAAASAFAEGQRAQLRGEYARAAELFELANETAPSAEALRSAIRNHRAAGGYAQAATCALEALARYPDDAASVQLANEMLTELSGRLGRVLLVCEPDCAAAVDGRVLSGAAFSRRELFLAPGDHEVRAEWPERPPVARQLTAVAGQTHGIRLERPAAPEPEPEPPPVAEPDVASPPQQPPPAPEPPRRHGLPPTFFWVGAGLTAIATGLTIWSGTDTLSARDDYQAAPTKAGYDDGVVLEVRTNLLIATSVALGVATAALAVFAIDWSPDSPTPTLALRPDGALLGIGGRL